MMAFKKCAKCELVVDRPNENRPGICCPECQETYCCKCAELSAEQCKFMKAMERCFWKCKECERQSTSLKEVMDSIKSIHSEMKKDQNDQKKERERVLEGLKVMETVASKIDKIEKVQEEHEERLNDHSAKIQKDAENLAREKERITAVEERMDKIDADALNVRQTNAVVREIREIEKREKNIIFGNIPETEDESAEERRKKDEEKIAVILKEMKADEIKPQKVIRVGVRGRYPRKVLVILQSAKECETVLKKGEMTQLSNDVFLTRDRTFNQRQEARLFRAEKEKEEREGTTRGGARGAGRGTGRPRGRGGGRGRGSVRGRGIGQTRSESRKRRNSNEDEMVKRQRINEVNTEQPATGPQNDPPEQPLETTNSVDESSRPESVFK